MTSSKTFDALLALTRLGIGNPIVELPDSIDWPAIEALANLQGLSAVVLDGIEELRKRSSNIVLPEKKVLTQWIGEVLQGYEYRFELYRRAIAEMAGFYNSHGYKMMVLKGYACSLDWPKPEHRPTGDIDIWQFGRQKEADAALVRETGIEIDSSHHHHTVFFWRDFMVENHYDFINVHHHKSNAEIEVILKEIARDDSHSDELYGEKVYLPSPNLHALFLLKHTMMHFASEGITLRQLLDWGFFVKAHGKDVDWKWLLEVLEKYNMDTLYNIFNAICVEDLGFESGLFPSVQLLPELKTRVLQEIISPEFGGELPKKLLPRMVYKYRRWKGSAWKHKLCYKESMWSAFWSGVWNHLLKPSSI